MKISRIGKMNCSHLVTAALIAAILTVTACSTTPTKAERDTSGKYDGNWTAQIQTANSPQRVQDWQLQCADLSQELPLKVADGEISVVIEQQTYTSYVGGNGKFNILIDAGKTTASASSESSLSNPNVRISIQGNLSSDPARGSFIVGLAEVGFAGCTSKVDYRRT